MKKPYLFILFIYLVSAVFAPYASAMNEDLAILMEAHDAKIPYPRLSKSGHTYDFRPSKGLKPNKDLPVPKSFKRENPAKAALDYVKAYLFSKDEGKFYTEDDFNFELKQDSIGLGRHIVRLKQKYNGIPVFGSWLSVDMNESGQLLHINGSVLPLITKKRYPSYNPENKETSVNPIEQKVLEKWGTTYEYGLFDLDLAVLIDSEQAALIAKEHMGLRYDVPLSEINSDIPELMIIDLPLVEYGYSGIILVWRIDTMEEGFGFGADVFVEVHTGEVVDTVSTIYYASGGGEWGGEIDDNDNANTVSPLPEPLVSAPLAVKTAPLGQFTNLGTYCFELTDKINPPKPAELLYLTAFSSDTEDYFPISGIHIAEGKRTPAYGNAVYKDVFGNPLVSITTSSTEVLSVYILDLSLSRNLHGSYDVISYVHSQSSTPRTIQPEPPKWEMHISSGIVERIDLCE